MGERLLDRRIDEGDVSNSRCEEACGELKDGAAPERGEADGERPKAFGFWLGWLGL